MSLDLWRVVAAHDDIVTTLAALAGGVSDAVRELVVRRWDPARSRLETVAVWAPARGAEPGALRTSLPTPRVGELLRWAADGRVTSWHDVTATGLARALGDGCGGGRGLAAAPLTGRDGALLGVLVVLGPSDSADDHRTWRTTLAEAWARPLAVALENDTRLHTLARLQEAAEADRRALEARLGRQDLGEAIVGADQGLREVMARVGQVAPTDAPVLVLGETGSGKEVVARAIHTRSPRAKGPFLRVNCGAIPTELVDSELFGHERGSFTGAIATRKGWFERADGGTLFLDEIGELPPAAQVRLLRVLQDGTFERVGGQRVQTADVRIVAATHRDIVRMVGDGSFRQDLWYRVSVFPLVLPALRERLEDIPALARHFALRAGERLTGRPLLPTDADLARLVAYPWPGNVRELAAVLERAAILGGGRGLDVATALGGATVSSASGRPTHAATAGHAPGEALRRGAGPPPPSSLEDDERATIEAAVAACQGRIEGPFGAARRLGVNPHTLRARMRRFGIDWARYRRR